MEIEILKWALLGLLGVATYFLKRTMDQLDKSLESQKNAHVLLNNEVQNIKNEYLHKNDFREFKTELWAKLDELKTDMKERFHNA